MWGERWNSPSNLSVAYLSCLLLSPPHLLTCPTTSTVPSVRTPPTPTTSPSFSGGSAWVVLTPTTTATTLLVCRRRSLKGLWLECPSLVGRLLVPTRPSRTSPTVLAPTRCSTIPSPTSTSGTLSSLRPSRSKNSWLPRGS